MVTWRATLDADTLTRVAQTRALKLTVNTLVQGAWALALQRMTHQPAVAFGATVAGRPMHSRTSIRCSVSSSTRCR